MILGVGVDLVDIRRINSAINTHGQKFLNRVFTAKEQARCNAKQQQGASYAKIYAAKEAVLKAIGNTRGIHWQHIEINKHDNGKPFVTLYENALYNYMCLIPPNMCASINLSITDEHPYAQAFAVIAVVI